MRVNFSFMFDIYTFQYTKIVAKIRLIFSNLPIVEWHPRNCDLLVYLATIYSWFDRQKFALRVCLWIPIRQQQFVRLAKGIVAPNTVCKYWDKRVIENDKKRECRTLNTAPILHCIFLFNTQPKIVWKMAVIALYSKHLQHHTSKSGMSDACNHIDVSERYLPLKSYIQTRIWRHSNRRMQLKILPIR